MIIKEKLGNLETFNDEGRAIDRLELEWFEINKRILSKQTVSGKGVILKFLDKAPSFKQDDVLFADEHTLIVVEILPAETIVIKPKSNYEIAYICYEIGNKHLPLFFEDELLMIPFDEPVYKMLKASGFEVEKQDKKLQHQLKTSVAPHTHSGESLFSKILRLS